ncbi:MAG: RIP metalloprotease RseP [Alphaproteobacteria bacterium]|nr:RIP metalloprotease RseP [Alphaproteobacteria bacterium]
MENILSFLQGSALYGASFIAVLGVVVFVHEFGHFWVARRCGVRIVTFSIGFGGEIFGWNDKYGTRWKVAWLPLGGYVKMFGDGDPSSSTVDDSVKDMSDKEKSLTFWHKSVGERFAIVAAGPSFNYIFAIIVLAVLFVFNGQPFTSPLVGNLVENSPAQKAGFLIGDRIIKMDGKQVERFEDIKNIAALNIGTPMSIDIERDGSPLTISVTPEVALTKDRLGGEHRMGRLGIASNAIEYKKHDPLSAVKYAVLDAWNITSGTIKAVGQMIIGARGTEELGGPIRIAEMSGNVAKEGFAAIVWFMAIISINLGLINFFPIPLLDGGNLVFYVIEFLRGRPVGDNVQEIGSRIGVLLVASLMLFATWNDLVHLSVVSYISRLFS